MNNEVSQQKKSTPLAVNRSTLFLAAIDVVLVLIWIKQFYYPYSKTPREYIEWIGGYISFIVGILFLPLSVMSTIWHSLKTHKFKDGEYKITEPIFSWIIVRLNKPVYGFIAFIVVMSLCILDCVLLVRLHAPAPPVAGEMVISNAPHSNKYFRVVDNHCIVIFSRDRKEEREQTQPAFICYSEADSRLEKIAVSHDDRFVYATDSKDGTVRVLGHDTLYGLRLIDKKYVGKTVVDIVLSADGKKLYAAVVGGGGTGMSGKIYVFNVSDSGISQKTVIENVGYPVSLYIASKSPYLFAGSQGGMGNDMIYVINTCTENVIRMIRGAGVINEVAATSDGKTAFFIAGSDGKYNLYQIKNPTTSKCDVTLIRMLRPSWIDTSITITVAPSTIAVTPNDKTLMVGTSFTATYRDGIRLRDTTFQGAINGFDIASSAFCDTKPFLTEYPPHTIAIADDGELITPMPPSKDFPKGRLAVGDSRALTCSKK